MKISPISYNFSNCCTKKQDKFTTTCQTKQEKNGPHNFQNKDKLNFNGNTLKFTNKITDSFTDSFNAKNLKKLLASMIALLSMSGLFINKCSLIHKKDEQTMTGHISHKDVFQREKPSYHQG